MDFREVNDKINEHYKQRALLRKEICKAIHDMVEELDGEFEVRDDEFEDEYLGICYDGGNHVEYASTMNSSLEHITSAIAKDPFTGEEYETFSADCEDEGGVEEYRLMFDDVCAIFDLVFARYKYIREIEG